MLLLLSCRLNSLQYDLSQQIRVDFEKAFSTKGVNVRPDCKDLGIYYRVNRGWEGGGGVTTFLLYENNSRTPELRTTWDRLSVHKKQCIFYWRGKVALKR